MALMLEGLRPKVNEIGRIRLGEKAPSGAPKRLTTFRLTSYDKSVLDAAQAIYGGDARPWKDAPDEGMWQLTTTVAAIDILIPRALQNVSQAYELWTGGACQRRCDGRMCELPEREAVACICSSEGKLGPDRECEVITRLSVILPRLPGLGVWRLDTGGWHAANTIPSTLDLLMALDARPMVPATLRAVQRSSKGVENGRTITHRFVVPVLDAPGITIGQLVDGAVHETAQLTDGRPRPLTAEERVAQRRAQIEAQTTSAPVSGGTGAATEEPLAHPAPAAESAAPIDSGAADDADVIDGQAVEVTEADEFAEAEPLTSGELRERMRSALISISDARKVAKDRYGLDSIDALTDSQRGVLWVHLDRTARP